MDKTRYSTIATACLLAGALAACGNDSKTPPADAQPVADARAACWSGGGTPTAGAEVELGTGLNTFEPLIAEQELPLYEGPQGGSHFFLHARIRGLMPGSSDDAAEERAGTWFSMYREDGEEMTLLPCAYPFEYIEDGDGAYILSYGHVSQISNRYVPEVFGQRVRIKVEVIDAQGRYAVDERWVVATRVEEPSMDAGVPDAATSDAGAF